MKRKIMIMTAALMLMVFPMMGCQQENDSAKTTEETRADENEDHEEADEDQEDDIESLFYSDKDMEVLELAGMSIQVPAVWGTEITESGHYSFQTELIFAQISATYLPLVDGDFEFDELNYYLSVSEDYFTNYQSDGSVEIKLGGNLAGARDFTGDSVGQTVMVRQAVAHVDNVLYEIILYVMDPDVYDNYAALYDTMLESVSFRDLKAQSLDEDALAVQQELEDVVKELNTKISRDLYYLANSAVMNGDTLKFYFVDEQYQDEAFAIEYDPAAGDVIGVELVINDEEALLTTTVHLLNYLNAPLSGTEEEFKSELLTDMAVTAGDFLVMFQYYDMGSMTGVIITKN